MAKVKFIGDPSGEEHRRRIEYAGVALLLGEWADMDDAAAWKLVKNPHFEVGGIATLPAAIVGARHRLRRRSMKRRATCWRNRIANSSKPHAALQAEHGDLLEAYAARGAELNDAHARIAELEAALANAAPAAQGESDGRDADGPWQTGC